MVSGNDTTESDVLGQGTWSNSSHINSATSAYQGSHVPQDLNNIAGSTSLTETRFKNAPPGTMQDNTTETRTTPSRGTAINSTSAPNSLTFEESTMSSIGNDGSTKSNQFLV